MRSFLLRWLKYIFLLGVGLVFGSASYLTLLLYQNWKNGELTELFLPPHQSPGYFFSYAGYHFFVPWLISLLAAILVSRLAERGNKRFGERFFETEEIGMMRLSIFLVGYPGILFYAILTLVSGLLFSIFYLLNSRGRAPLYYLWLPLGIAVILAEKFLIPASLIRFFTL